MSRTAEDNAVEFGSLSKQGKDLRLALLVACSVEKEGHGGNRRSSNSRNLKLNATAFARKAGTTAPRVLRHLETWDRFAKKAKLPIASRLSPEDAVGLGISEEQAEMWETIGLHSVTPSDVKGAQVTKVITQNHPALTAAIKSDPKTAAAAAQALVETGNVSQLSQATAKAAQNKQVERNRARAAAGNTTKPKPPAPVDKVLMFRGIPNALTALNTTFRDEWNSLSQDEQNDPENIELFSEGFDQIQIALDSCRVMIGGGVSDEDLESLMRGAS